MQYYFTTFGEMCNGRWNRLELCHPGIVYSSIGRRAAIMRWCYTSVMTAFALYRIYSAFAARKPALA